jgi:hypothetical protein
MSLPCSVDGLHNQLHLRLHFHTLSHSTVLSPHSLNLRDTVSPQKVVTRVSHWLEVDQTPLLPPNLNPGSYQSDGQHSLHWFLLLTGFRYVSKALHPDLPGGQGPPPNQAVHWCLVGSFLPSVWWTQPQVSAVLAVSPQLMLWETQTETWDSEARKQHFIVLAQIQRTLVQRLSPENKGVSPMYPCKQVTQANKGLTHIWLYAIV